MHKLGLNLWLPIVMLIGLLAGCDFGSKVTAKKNEPAPQTPDNTLESTSLEQVQLGIDDLVVPEPSPSEPVTALMKFFRTKGSTGNTGELLVAIRIARAHYVYAANDPGGPFASLGLDVTLPKGMTAIGDWIYPLPEKGRADKLVYRDSVLLRRSLNMSSNASSQALVTGKLRYQVCNEELCWPAKTLDLSTLLMNGSPSR